MKSKLTLSLLFVAVAAAVIAWKEATHANTASAATQSVSDQNRRIAARIEQTKTRVAAAEHARADLRNLLARARTARGTSASEGPASENATGTSEKSLQQKLAARDGLKSTEQQILQLADKRWSNERTLRSLIGALELSPARANRLVTILLGEYELNMDLGELKKQGVLATDDPVIKKVQADAKAERERACRELLGEAGYAQYQEYARAATARFMIIDFAGVAAMGGVPFSRPQLEQLVGIVANNSSDYRQGGSVSWKLDTIDWDAVDAQVRTLMSDAQWNLWSTISPDREWDRSWSRLRSAIAKATQADVARKTGTK